MRPGVRPVFGPGAEMVVNQPPPHRPNNLPSPNRNYLNAMYPDRTGRDTVPDNGSRQWGMVQLFDYQVSPVDYRPTPPPQIPTPQRVQMLPGTMPYVYDPPPKFK